MKKFIFILFGIFFLSSCIPHNLIMKDVRDKGGRLFQSIHSRGYEVSENGNIIQKQKQSSTLMYHYFYKGDSYWRIGRPASQSISEIPTVINFKVLNREVVEEIIIVYHGYDEENDVRYKLTELPWTSFRGKFYILTMEGVEQQLIWSASNGDIRLHRR